MAQSPIRRGRDDADARACRKDPAATGWRAAPKGMTKMTIRDLGGECMTYCLVCRQYTPPKGGAGKTYFYCGNSKCRHDNLNTAACGCSWRGSCGLFLKVCS